MKLITLLAFLTSSLALGSEERSCTCTCVVKQEEGGYTTETAKGPDREAAGQSLKKKLGKRKCELSPDCTGKGCKLDD